MTAVPAKTDAPRPASRKVAVPERAKLETWLWQFMRISGVALIPLAFGHLAIMHILNSVHDMNLCFVAARWDMLAWRLYDAALLGFALIHGFNGLRYVAGDYIHAPGLKRVVNIIIVLACLGIFLFGGIALIGGVRIVPLPADCI